MTHRAWFVGWACALACGGAEQSSLLGDSGTPQNDASMQAETGGMDAPASQDVAVNDAPILEDAAPDLAVGPPDTTIQCGPTLTCSAKTQICCDHSLSTTWQCVTDVSACSGAGDVPIGCSDHTNCVSQGSPADICCATVVQETTCAVATSVACSPTCEPTAGQIQVGCGGAEMCPMTETCKESTCTLPGYYICDP